MLVSALPVLVSALLVLVSVLLAFVSALLVLVSALLVPVSACKVTQIGKVCFPLHMQTLEKTQRQHKGNFLPQLIGGVQDPENAQGPC